MTDGIIFKRRLGTYEDPFVSYSVPHQVVNGKVQLNELPDKYAKVQVTGHSITWIESTKLPLGTNDYFVDYNTGLVTFNTAHNDKTLTFVFKGIGVPYAPASRIYLNEANGQPTDSVKDKLNEMQAQVNTLVVNGDSSAAASQASVNRQGVVFPSLKERIDNEQQKLDLAVVDSNNVTHSSLQQRLNDRDVEVTSQLLQKTKEIKQSVVEGYGIPKTIKMLYEGKRPRVVVVGHSLSFGSGAGDTTQDWESLVYLELHRRFPTSNIFWRNSAVGGTTSTHLKDNWDNLVTQYAPTLIIIGHGTNDVNMTDVERKQNYDFFAKKAGELGAEVLLVTDATVSLKPAPYGNTPDLDVVRREEIAEQTREFAREYRFGLCDPWLSWRRWLTDRGYTVDSTILLYDHIHFNDIGHKLAAYEVLMAFTGVPTRELDRKYGGKGYDLFGKLTFRDLAHRLSNKDGWGMFDLDNQLVDWGGLWWTRDYLSRAHKKAKLYGTQAVTGSEAYKNNYQPTWHVIPNAKDYIELEVRNAKRVWFALDGSSATTTEFSVIVNGTVVQTIQVSSGSKAPVEVNFNTGALKLFPKGTHKVRIERVGTIPSLDFVEFHGFVVQYYKENEPEIFNTPTNQKQVVTPTLTYQTQDTTITTRQKATDIGLLAPFGYAVFDGGFLQLALNQPAVLVGEFYGDTLTLKLKNTLVDNYIMIYVDDVLKETVNFKDTSYTQNVRTYQALGTNKKHTFYAVAMNAQINLEAIRYSDTLT